MTMYGGSVQDTHTQQLLHGHHASTGPRVSLFFSLVQKRRPQMVQEMHFPSK